MSLQFRHQRYQCCMGCIITGCITGITGCIIYRYGIIHPSGQRKPKGIKSKLTGPVLGPWPRQQHHETMKVHTGTVPGIPAHGTMHGARRPATASLPVHHIRLALPSEVSLEAGDPSDQSRFLHATRIHTSSLTDGQCKGGAGFASLNPCTHVRPPPRL